MSMRDYVGRLVEYNAPRNAPARTGRILTFLYRPDKGIHEGYALGIVEDKETGQVYEVPVHNIKFTRN